MGSPLDVVTLKAFATSILIGALLGIEREKRKHLEGAVGVGGIRTFTVLAILGAVAGFLAHELSSPWILLAVVLAVAVTVAGAVIIDARHHSGPVGLTTEFAALVTVFLGALPPLGHSDLAVVLGIVTGAVLAYKQPLHGFVEKLGWDDIFAMLRFLIASFIILPILPNHPVDPLGSLNPYRLWLLVLLISSLSVLGYVAARWFGDRRGILFAGVAGGLVSSTAVTISFARQARDRAPRLFLAGMFLAWAIMFLRVIVLAAIVYAELIPHLLLPFGIMAAVSLGAALIAYRSARTGAPEESHLELRNPFSLRVASEFAAFFALILFAVAAAERYLPAAGTYAVAAFAGLTDVDAITLSMSEQAKTGSLTVPVFAIVIASLSNTVVRGGLSAVIGPRSWRAWCMTAAAAILAAGSIALIASRNF